MMDIQPGATVSAEFPTRVAMWALRGGPGEFPIIAEFRYSAESGVTLTEVDSSWTDMAQKIYERGIRSFYEGRIVSPSEGPAFMKALL